MLSQIVILTVGLFSFAYSCGNGPCESAGFDGGMSGNRGGMGAYGDGMRGYGGIMGGYGAGTGMSKPKPYNFNYQTDGMGANSFRTEQGDSNGNVQGSYGYTDSQGLYRQVQYTAGAGGFRATVKTNEPGTDSKPESPADVNMIAEPAPAGIQDRYTRRAGAGGYGVTGGYGVSEMSGLGGGVGGGLGGMGTHGAIGGRMGGYGGVGGGMIKPGGMSGFGGSSSGLFAGMGQSGSRKSIY